MHELTLQFPKNLDPRQFLERYWQKQPVLLRQALPGFSTPIEPDELAGLACEEEVESRLVLEKDGDHPWQVHHGPFSDDDFANLPDSHWTLLVQDVEKHLPELQAITNLFRFIPDWRIDDLMISFAPEAGSVGPHTDQYDVFLLQAHGKRRWEISSSYNPALLDDIDLQILKSFDAEQSWVLEPGDILYLPPGVAHHGIAKGDCMTFSIGFRAPTQQQLGEMVLESIHTSENTPRFYHDPDLVMQEQPAEISAPARQQLRHLVREQLALDDDELDDITCRYLSLPKDGLFTAYDNPALDQQTFIQHWEHSPLLQHPAIKVLFSRCSKGLCLYINGDCHTLPACEEDILQMLTGQNRHMINTYLPSSHFRDIATLMHKAWGEGTFCFDD